MLRIIISQGPTLVIRTQEAQGLPGGTNWIANEQPSGAIDGVNTTFTLPNSRKVAADGNGNPAILFMQDTAIKNYGEDYTVAVGSGIITMLFAPNVGALLRVFYFYQ
jgi:hypothetical protein